MTNVSADRRVEHDWSTRQIPPNVTWGDGFFCESAQCFLHFKGKREPAIEFGEHVSVYAASQFAVGEQGHIRIGDFTLLVGALITCETSVEIGSHCLISWGPELRIRISILWLRPSAGSMRKRSLLFMRDRRSVRARR
jgi:hypothetical protein